MATVQNEVNDLRNITDNSFSIWNTVDHRVDGWLLMSTYKQILIVIIIYSGVVCIGPKIMSNRKPFQATATMLAYNLILSSINFYICFQYAVAFMGRKSPWTCHVKPSVTTDDEDLRIVSTNHLMFLTKPLELLDTWFFILRKKENQLSFLHVYHHIATVAFAWIIVRWIPNDATYIGCLLNSGIHVIMYCYYGLSLLGPNVQKYLWWKKHLTTLQIIQFVLGILIELGVIISGCSPGMWIHYAFICYVVSLLFLFLKFYRKTYKQKTH
ncbi:hypothetical protein CHUAL_001930 [Chamberlinius hualienensis]